MVFLADLLQSCQARLVGLGLPVGEIALLLADAYSGIDFMNTRCCFHKLEAGQVGNLSYGFGGVGWVGGDSVGGGGGGG